MSNVDKVKAKVQTILTEKFSNVQLWEHGYMRTEGSARGFVQVVDHDEITIVRLTFPLVFEATTSPELYKYVAENADRYVFGHLFVDTAEDGTATIFFRHQLLGDYLDDDELGWALAIMSAAADAIDDELVSKFGGRTFEG